MAGQVCAVGKLGGVESGKVEMGIEEEASSSGPDGLATISTGWSNGSHPRTATARPTGVSRRARSCGSLRLRAEPGRSRLAVVLAAAGSGAGPAPTGAGAVTEELQPARGAGTGLPDHQQDQRLSVRIRGRRRRRHCWCGFGRPRPPPRLAGKTRRAHRKSADRPDESGAGQAPPIARPVSPATRAAPKPLLGELPRGAAPGQFAVRRSPKAPVRSMTIPANQWLAQIPIIGYAAIAAWVAVEALGKVVSAHARKSKQTRDARTLWLCASEAS